MTKQKGIFKSLSSSDLSLLLFLIYINDFCTAKLYDKVTAFVYGTILMCLGTNLHGIISLMKQDLIK